MAVAADIRRRVFFEPVEQRPCGATYPAGERVAHAIFGLAALGQAVSDREHVTNLQIMVTV